MSKKDKQKTGIIYCYKPINSNRDILSIKAQKEMCTEKAKQDEVEIIDVIEDTGQREQLAKLLSYSKTNRINKVYVSSIDRLASGATGIPMTDLPTDKVVSSSQNLNQSQVEFMLFMSYASAQSERMEMSYQVKRGIARRNKALEGLPKKCECGSRIKYNLQHKSKKNGEETCCVYGKCANCDPINWRLAKVDDKVKLPKFRRQLVCKDCGRRLKQQ